MHALEGFSQKRGAFSGECNQDEDGKVSSLLCSIKEFDFIIALCVAEHVVNPVARTNVEGIVSLLIFMTFIMILAPLAASISSAFVKQLVLVAPRLSIVRPGLLAKGSYFLGDKYDVKYDITISLKKVKQ